MNDERGYVWPWQRCRFRKDLGMSLLGGAVARCVRRKGHEGAHVDVFGVCIGAAGVSG